MSLMQKRFYMDLISVIPFQYLLLEFNFLKLFQTFRVGTKTKNLRAFFNIREFLI